MDIIECLLRDHERLKAKVARIKSESSVPHKESAFQELCDLLESHTEAEETVVFSRALRDPALRPNALEGIEKHIMIEMLLTRTRHTDDSEMRGVRMKVACDLLAHHLEKKEKEFFPKFIERFESDDRQGMAEDYMHIRQRDDYREGEEETARVEETIQVERPLPETRL